MKSVSVTLWLCFVSGLGLKGAETDWPEFRGPQGDGTTFSARLPLHWGDEKNSAAVKWSTVIHGKAWSSPVIWDRQVWMTTATEDGHELFVICADADTGKI